MKYISNDKLKEYITGAVCFKEADAGLIPYRVFGRKTSANTRKFKKKNTP